MQRSLLFIVAAVFLVSLSPASPLIRVACVGNSITYGYELPRREQQSYPARLQAMLGSGYTVGNFGVNGATLCTDGNKPYTSLPEYNEARAFQPNIVFIMLGTNDSKMVNRGTLGNFVANYDSLIEAFRRLASAPRIILLLPPPVFSDDTVGITEAVIRDRIIPDIRTVAYQSGCEIINLYNLFLDRSVLFPDHVHPLAEGADIIAGRLFEHLRMPSTAQFNFIEQEKIPAIHGNYYGYDCYDFAFEGRDARIAVPKRAAPGHPWLWRARFWGHEPQTEIALLERGFHIVYCDVTELMGNNEALGRWNRFYSMLVHAGFAEKPALEAFSRGGMYAYRWAAANPRHVACVYADAPVLDVKSWPGGRGKGAGNPVEWERFKQNFSLSSDQEALAFDGNPLDLASTIARAGFPMLHICGAADPVVPIEENTDRFEQKIRKAGGTITVIRKPGVGHHPHSLPNPQRIVDFILYATGQRI